MAVRCSVSLKGPPSPDLLHPPETPVSTTATSTIAHWAGGRRPVAARARMFRSTPKGMPVPEPGEVVAGVFQEKRALDLLLVGQQIQFERQCECSRTNVPQDLTANSPWRPKRTR